MLDVIILLLATVVLALGIAGLVKLAQWSWSWFLFDVLGLPRNRKERRIL